MGIRSIALAGVLTLSACVGAPGYTIAGNISGAMISGVTVNLSAPGLTPDRTTKTNSQGRYTFTDLAEGTYTLRPLYAGVSFTPASASVTVGRADVTGADFSCHPLLEVWGRDMSPSYQNVNVVQGGTPVNDAEVKVNGQPLTHPPGYYEDGYYQAQVNSVGTGGTLVLEVTRAGATMSAAGVVPEAPVLTGPANGATFAASDDILVTWSSATQPDRFDVSAQWSCGPVCGTGATFSVPGTARSYTIRAGAVPTRTSIDISVFAYSDGTFSGDYAPHKSYPGMNIRAESFRITVSR